MIKIGQKVKIVRGPSWNKVAVASMERTIGQVGTVIKIEDHEIEVSFSPAESWYYWLDMVEEISE